MTLPIVLIGMCLVYGALIRFYTFEVQYDPMHAKLPLSVAGKYELDALHQAIRVGISRVSKDRPVFRQLDLFLPESRQALLESNMPQSGFDYVRGRLLIDGKLVKAKIKYRGDFLYHWAWNKKSLRIKTDKDNLFEGVRKFNLQAPKTKYQLNNYLALQLADRLGVIAPKTELVSVSVNNRNRGVHVFVEQLTEGTLRRSGLMPADIYRGELVGKDAFVDSGIKTLFKTTSVWDKMAINNHYDENSTAPLDYLLQLIQTQDDVESQIQLSELLDIEAWARFSVFETLIQTNRYLPNHNWRLYYDPWRQKMIPIAWDPVGWPKYLWPKPGEQAASIVIITTLHKALFKNGDFLRARDRVLREFFDSGLDSDFLEIVDQTVTAMDRAIKADPNLHPADPAHVSASMHAMRTTIQGIFSDIELQAQINSDDIRFSLKNDILSLSVFGHHPVYRLRLDFESLSPRIPQLRLGYDTGSDRSVIDGQGMVGISGNKITIDGGFLPAFKLSAFSRPSFPTTLVPFPAFYDIEIDGLDDAVLVAVYADMGAGWQRVNETNDIRLDPDLANKYNKDIRHTVKQGWRFFWDTGQGFNQDESSSRLKVSTTKDGKYWYLARKFPANLKRLRIDLPADRELVLSNITAIVEGKRYQIPVSALTVYNMDKVGQTSIRSKPDNASFFFFDLPGGADANRKQSMPVKVVFEAKLILPWDRAIKEASVGVVAGIHAPISPPPLVTPLIWSDEVSVSGLLTIDRPLIIRPGTKILMGEGATLIVRNRLIAEGTAKAPIRFLPQNKNQAAWGALVLSGAAANGSRLSHCRLAQGSGLKTDLFEYTAMLSIHDVNDVVVSDCTLRDSKVTDDMVHAVYSQVRFERCKFINSLSDAVDIDISDVVIVDSVFLNSGNDAVDLMTSTAGIFGTTFRGSGDKGVSVGEGSQLLAIDNQFIENLIGVQAKDQSVAILINQTLKNNSRALHAYKKNWRYGDGGTIVVSKSRLMSNDTPVTAKKRSNIIIFDSYSDNPKPEKRVTFNLVDNQSVAKAKKILPERVIRDLAFAESIVPELRKHARLNQRGAYTDAR